MNSKVPLFNDCVCARVYFSPSFCGSVYHMGCGYNIGLLYFNLLVSAEMRSWYILHLFRFALFHFIKRLHERKKTDKIHSPWLRRIFEQKKRDIQRIKDLLICMFLCICVRARVRLSLRSYGRVVPLCHFGFGGFFCYSKIFCTSHIVAILSLVDIFIKMVIFFS